MSEPPATQRRLSQPQIVLVALSLVSVVPPLLYYRAIDPLLDSTRIGGGLLPGHFLFFRYFGHASVAVAVIVVLLSGCSFLYRASAADFARRAILVVVVFQFVYLCYALFMIAVMFMMRDI